MERAVLKLNKIEWTKVKSMVKAKELEMCLGKATVKAN